MLYLLLAIISSAMISVLMRLSERHINNNITMLAANYLACTTLSALYAGPTQLFPAIEGQTFVLLLGAFSGVLFLASFVLYNWNVRNNGVVLSATFMKLGVLVPTTMSVVLFREIPALWQIIGYALALSAIALIHFDGARGQVRSKWLLLCLLLGGGLTDGMAKVFEEFGVAVLKNQFLFYNFLTALILCVLLMWIQKQKFGWAELGFGLLLGIPNYFSSRFLLLSLQDISAIIAYPSYSVATIVVASAAGMLLFRERLSKRKLLAMGLILLSLVLLNL